MYYNLQKWWTILAAGECPEIIGMLIIDVIIYQLMIGNIKGQVNCHVLQQK
jgi:hypothetical protein